jgi:hypothetical protein
MSLIHRFKIATLGVCIFLLSACSSMVPTQNTFANGAESTPLTTAQDGSQRYLRAPIAPQTEMHLTEVNLQLAADNTTVMSDEERAELVGELRQQLISQLGKHYKWVDTPSASAVRVRATITEVRTSNVFGNVVATVLLFDPVDKGGATVELEASSPKGERLAALSVAAQGKLFQFRGAYSRLGQAKLALSSHATSFAAMLQGATVPTTN